jgi:hypothetical protein
MALAHVPLWLLPLALLACGPEDGTPAAATTVMMDLTGSSGFYGAPFPSDHRLRDGAVDISDHPNPDGVAFVDQVVELVDGRMAGFSTTSAVFFALDGPIEAPASGFGHTGSDAVAFIVGVEPGSRDYGLRIPIELGFEEDGSDFGADNLLSLLPLQGRPMLPSTRYAAVVTRGLLDVDGAPVGPSETLHALLRGEPAGLPAPAWASYQAGIAELGALGVSVEDLAGVAVFTTQDPTDQLRQLTDAVQALEPIAPNTTPTLTDTYDDYCVFRTAVSMPVYQEGEPPFMVDGGTFAWDEQGEPLLQGWEEANLDLTVPRSAMPAAGYPMVVFIRTGGGGERPMVDRGPVDAAGAQPTVPGEGPAWHFARAGFAGLSVDGPHGGLRNVSGSDEQFLMFNILNPGAMRDNVRQSAIELTLLPDLIDTLELDVSACDGAGDEGFAHFDTSALALMGHSMGATIAPLVTGVEPDFDALILSGAGGSWTQNIIYKQSPLVVRPMAEAMIGYDEGQLTTHDPFLNLLQWGGESSDPPVYGAVTQDAGVHVLMLQGIIDSYILPPIANSTSLSLGLDLGGASLDAEHPELQQYTPLEQLLPWTERGTLDLPIAGNADGATRVVVQHAEDGILDGHEVVFQRDAPKDQYRHFLESWAAGTPEVPE